MSQKLLDQLKVMEDHLHPETEVHKAVIELVKTLKMFYEYMEEKMDKSLQKELTATVIKRGKARMAKGKAPTPVQEKTMKKIPTAKLKTKMKKGVC